MTLRNFYGVRRRIDGHKVATVGVKFPIVTIQISRIPNTQNSNDLPEAAVRRAKPGRKRVRLQHSPPCVEGLDDPLTSPQRSELEPEEKLKKPCSKLSPKRKETPLPDGDQQKDSGNRVKVHCPMCRVGLRDIFKLRRHFIMHLESNPFVCKFPGCGQNNQDVNRLKKHILSSHMKTENPDVTTRMLADIESLSVGRGSLMRLIVKDPVYQCLLLEMPEAAELLGDHSHSRNHNRKSFVKKCRRGTTK